MAQIGIERVMKLFDLVTITKKVTQDEGDFYVCDLANVLREPRGHAFAISRRSWRDSLNQAYTLWSQKHGVARSRNHEDG